MLRESKHLRYLLAGGWNTAFGYGAMGVLYETLSPKLGVVIVAIIANMLSITMSFITYKIFVFQKKGNWLHEYIKCYVVYGGLALLNIILIWLFIEKFNFSVWLSQGICIPLGVIISYYLHLNFTFLKSNRINYE